MLLNVRQPESSLKYRGEGVSINWHGGILIVQSFDAEQASGTLCV
jgi:hypothetical protein